MWVLLAIAVFFLFAAAMKLHAAWMLADFAGGFGEAVALAFGDIDPDRCYEFLELKSASLVTDALLYFAGAVLVGSNWWMARSYES